MCIFAVGLNSTVLEGMQVVGKWRWLILLFPVFMLLGSQQAFAQDDILDEIEAELKKEQEQKKAQAKAEKNAEKNKALSQAALRRGDAFLKSKKYADAIKAYEEAKKVWPDNAALAEQQIGRAKEAQKEAEEASKQAEIKAKYDGFITKADAYFKSKKWNEAIAQYQEAAKADPSMAYPKDQIGEAKTAMAKEAEEKAKAEAAAKLNKDYSDALAAGDAALKAKNFDEAIAKYTAAMKLKPTEPEAQSRKATAEKQKADEAKRLAQEKIDNEYNAIIAEADALLKDSKFDEAKAKYEAASKVKTSETYPKTKMKECDDAKLAVAQAATKAQYDALIKEADDLLKSQNFDGAVAKYEEAQKVLPHESFPAEMIKQANELKKQKADNELKMAFDAIVKEGEDLMAAEKFDESIAKFKEAHQKMPTEDKTSALIAQAEKLKEEKAQNAIQADYDAKIKEGEALLSSQDYDGAIAKFKEAKGILAADPKADQLIEQANKLKADKKMAETQAKFDEQIKAGEKLLEEQRFDEAIAAFNEAKKIIPTDSKPQTLIDQANNLRADLEKQKAKAEFDELVAAGDNALSEQNFEGAKAKYKEALAAYADGQSTIDAKLKEVSSAEQAKADEAKAAAEAQAKKDKFDGLLSEVDGLIAANKLDEAKAKIGEALGIFPNDETATAKKNEIEQLQLKAQKEEEERLAQEAAAKEQAEKEKQANDFVAQAEAARAAQKFEEANGFVNSALSVIPDFAPAIEKQKQIADDKKAYDDKLAQEAAEKQAAEEAAAAETKKIKDLLAEGTNLISAGEFDKAIAKMDEVLSIDADNTDAKAKKDEALKGFEQKKQQEAADAEAAKLAQAEADKKAQVDGLISEGEGLLSSGDFDGAITKFEGALAIDAANTLAQSKIDEAKAAQQKAAEEKAAADKAEQERLAKEAADAEAAKLAQAEADKKAQVDGLISEGEGLLSSGDFAGAITKFEGALAIDAANTLAQSKIDEAKAAQQKAAEEKAAADKAEQERLAKEAAEAEAAKQAQALKEREESIAAGVAAAKQLESNSDWKGALNKWNEVLAIDAANADAKSGIERANTEIAKAEELAKKEAEALAAEEAKRAKEQAEQDKQAKIATLSSEADAAEQNGEFDAAIAKWNEVLNLDASAATATAGIARINTKKKAAKEKADAEAEKKRLAAEAEAKKQAELAKQKAAEEKQASIERLKAQAKSQEVAKEYQQALSTWNEIESIDAGNADAASNISRLEQKIESIDAQARAEEEAKRKAAEEAAAKQAAAEKRKLVASYIATGDNVLAEKQYVKAIESYEKALELDPNSSEAQTKLNRTKDLKMAEDARIAGMEAEELKQEISSLLADAKYQVIKRQYKNAEANYQKVLSYDASNATAKEGLASIQKNLDLLAKQEAEAEAKRKLEEENNKKIEVILDAGADLFAGGQYQKAIEKYQEGLKINPLHEELKSSIRNAKATLERAELYRLARINHRPPPKPQGFKTENISNNKTRADKVEFQHQLAKKYPEGVTEENKSEKRKEITRRVVIKEGNGTEYYRIRHDWGGTYYFKDGESITPYLWQYGTRKPDEITN